MPYEEQFAALSNPLRQQILAQLAQQPCSVRDLTDRISASQPVVSQHLKVLRDAGLVDVTPDGTRRIYHVEAARLQALRVYLTQHWLTALESLDKTGGSDA